jgi:transposase
VFKFRGRRGDLVKVLWWSGDGMCLLMKRLEAGRFIWPSGSETVTLSVGQLHWLLDGIDLAIIQKHPRRFYERTG